MNTIAELGDSILNAQAKLGLENPKFYSAPLTASEFQKCPLFSQLPRGSELHDLFSWKNGASGQGVPIGKLWLKPGFYLYSAQESVISNRYCAKHFEDWERSWYPLLTDGSADSRFCDINKVSRGRLAVYYYEPEESPVFGQIYDSIQLMFQTIVECYERGVFFVDPKGYLGSDFSREVQISGQINPNSEFWRRIDLLKK